MNSVAAYNEARGMNAHVILITSVDTKYGIQESTMSFKISNIS